MTEGVPARPSRLWLVVPILIGLAAAGYFGVRWMTLSNAASTVSQAQQALVAGDSEQARAAVDWLLYFEPDQKEAAMIVAASYAAEEKYTDALRYLDRVPDGDLQNTECDLKAACLIGDNQWDRAEALLTSALQGGDMDQLLVDRLARLYLSQLRHEDAVQILDRYLADADGRDALMSSLELLAVSQSPDGYLGGLEVADQQRPGQKSVTLGLATGYALSGQVDAAGAMFDAAVQRWPADADVLLAAAEFRLGTGEITEAQTLMARLTEDAKAQEFHRYWFLLARLSEEQAEIAEAVSRMKRAIELSVPRETYLQMASRLARREGRREDAVTLVTAAAQLARQRQRLMKLFPGIDVRRPDAELFNEVAGIVDHLGYEKQAIAWRRLAGLAGP